MRIWPVVSVPVLREATKDIKLGEFEIPKGTRIWSDLMVVQNAENFDNPDTFMPDRWLEK
jgi:cytochrome P450